MKVHRCLQLLAAALPLLACEPGPPPNVVLLVGDDHGYPDFGFMGSPVVETPQLDALAREGTVFTRSFVTASVCRPSLRTLLTGLYPRQWNRRIEQLHACGLRPEPGQEIRYFEVLPDLLRERGYASYQTGKFWESHYADAGFDEGTQTRARGRGVSESDVVGRETLGPVVEFLESHRDRPFFLWFAPRLPHAPHDAGPRYLARYRGRGLSEPAARYYASVTRFDDAVGGILYQLDRLGLRERTLVVYLADNGWDQGGQAVHPNRRDGPRGKQTAHELGLRTPLVLSWPGRVPRDARREQLISSVDLLPTLLDFVGAEIPAGLPGLSAKDLAESGAAWPREEVIGWHEAARIDRRGRTAIWSDAFSFRDTRWRYIWYRGAGDDALYDTRRDSRETRDLRAGFGEVVARARAAIEAWDARVLAQVESSCESLIEEAGARCIARGISAGRCAQRLESDRSRSAASPAGESRPR